MPSSQSTSIENLLGLCRREQQQPSSSISSTINMSGGNAEFDFREPPTPSLSSSQRDPSAISLGRAMLEGRTATGPPSGERRLRRSNRRRRNKDQNDDGETTNINNEEAGITRKHGSGMGRSRDSFLERLIQMSMKDHKPAKGSANTEFDLLGVSTTSRASTTPSLADG